MDEPGRLESLPRGFMSKLGVCEGAQFIVNQRQQGVTGLRIALINRIQDLSHLLSHLANCTRSEALDDHRTPELTYPQILVHIFCDKLAIWTSYGLADTASLERFQHSRSA